MNMFRRRRNRLAVLLAALPAAAVGLAGCGGSDSSSGSGAKTTVNLVEYAVTQSAYEALGDAFSKTDAGKGVTFKGSYGASGAQSRAVIAGQKADYVGFSVTPDLTNVVKAGLVDAGWNSGPSKGMVSDSVVVIAFRKGNPKGITGWDDIIKPGVGIVTADPGTSGSAKWNLLAAYAQALGPNSDEAAAKTYLAGFIKNVVSWNDSGRSATDAFVKGTGDVLISYENEAITARAAGVELEYAVPDSTVLIENPAAVTKTAPRQAKDFLAFVQSTEGQKIFASKGFRPIDRSITATDVQGATDPAKPFPAVANLTTVKDLGGWSDVNKKFFDKESGLVAELRRASA